jgi:predicted SprT family Zn-dependent metalloprotease
MAYYIEKLPDRRCRCGRRASVALKSSGTVTYGYYCQRCGDREARTRNAEERMERIASGPTL